MRKIGEFIALDEKEASGLGEIAIEATDKVMFVCDPKNGYSDVESTVTGIIYRCLKKVKYS